LDSLPDGCPVLLVDAHSSDRTAEIARARGAAVLEREWRGFIDARLFALSAVRNPWTLMVDADELLDERLRLAIVAADGQADGYRLSRTTFFCGRPMRIWSGERILRLFQTAHGMLRSRAVSDDAQVHEVWSVPGRIADLPGTLLHYSYPTVASYRAKFEHYTDLEAQATKATPLTVVREELRALARFLYLAFVAGAMLDGWRGIFTAWWSARYRAVVFRKALRRST
jgi:glycosyltransferase involved in cell wall biosynthesis